MELPCVVSINSAYDLPPSLSGAVEITTGVTERATEERRKIQLQSNNAYGSYAHCLPKRRVQTRQADHAHAQDWNLTATTRANSASEPVSLHDDGKTAHDPKRPSTLLSSNSIDRVSVAFFENRRAKRKGRKCSDLTYAVTIALVAMISITLSGIVIVLSITCELSVVPSRGTNRSHTENKTTTSDRSELNWNSSITVST